MTMTSHLVIMAKLPRAGRVKTRLAREIGATEAVRVYRTVLNETITCLGADQRWRLWLTVAPDTSIADPYWPSTVTVCPQGPGDLGQRMQRQLDRMPPGPVVIIGSDIPGIQCDDIAAAFEQLGRHDVVFGPAPDGGYWLVGARRRPRVPRLFERVRWSGPHALSDTISNAGELSVGLVREIADLDTGEDYRTWRSATRFARTPP